MKQKLDILILQTNTVWEQPQKNTTEISQILRKCNLGNPDLILLPEMFATGFTTNISAVEQKEGFVFEWMNSLARSTGSVFAGTVATYNNNDIAVNRFYWVRPNGSYEFYDKYHLFGIGKEKLTYTRGEQHRPIEEWGWKIMPNICYDLRFPSYCRNRLLNKGDYLYDLTIFLANWPKIRAAHWTSLLKARAIENMAYVIGVNRVGVDGYGLNYGGNSAVFDPMNGSLWEAETDLPQAGWVTLSYEELKKQREGFPVAIDWDF